MSAEFRLDMPKRLRTGPPELVREWNRMVKSMRDLEQAIRARTLRPSDTIRVQIGPSGSFANVKARDSSRPRSYPNLWVHLFQTGGTWKIKVEPGVVRYQNIGDASKLGQKTPTLGGTSIAADPAPSATVSGTLIYVRQTTDNRGIPNADPTIVQASSAQTTTHHVPPDPGGASGTAGDYYFLIAELNQNGSDYTVSRRHCGNPNIPNQLIEIENLGTGAEVYKNYDEANDVHQLRSLVERATNIAIQVDEETDEIRIHGTGEDHATVTFPDPCDTGYWTMNVTDGLISALSFTSY